MNKKLLLSMAFCLTATLLTACGDDSNSSSANTPDLLYPTSVGLVYSDNTVRDDFGNVIGVYDAATNVVTLSDGTVVSLSEDDLIAVSSSSENFGWWQSSSSFTGIGVVVKPNWAYLNPNINYGMFTDSRDGQVYKTVKIGTQTWMAENLNYSDSVRTPSLKKRSWCYENSADSCAKYGRLYSREVAKSVCPEGWHLPTGAEWQTLYDFVENDQGVGIHLKSQRGWGCSDDVSQGQDTYGFSALPAGLFSMCEENCGSFLGGSFSLFFEAGTDASFWADSYREEYGDVSAYWSVNCYYGNVFKQYGWEHEEYSGMPVRCVKEAG